MKSLPPSHLDPEDLPDSDWDDDAFGLFLSDQMMVLWNEWMVTILITDVPEDLLKSILGIEGGLFDDISDD